MKLTFVPYGLCKELHEIHLGLYSDLIKACSANNVKLHMVFLNWKDKFLIYGSICSNLSSARRAIKSAICRSREVAEKIEVFIHVYTYPISIFNICNPLTSVKLNKYIFLMSLPQRCQREASEGALNLEDLITLPMQRLLKYPLLLENLCKHTDKVV